MTPMSESINEKLISLILIKFGARKMIEKQHYAIRIFHHHLVSRVVQQREAECWWEEVTTGEDPVPRLEGECEGEVVREERRVPSMHKHV